MIVRHNVISLVEGSPHKLCDQGWDFDHRNVFNTITSEVRTGELIIFNLFVIPSFFRTTGCVRRTTSQC